MSLQVKYTHQAYKDINKLSTKEKERIIKAIKFILVNPLAGKPLQAWLKGKYSFRIGNLRIIYTTEFKDKLIIVLKVRHRKEAYK